jgi:DNA-binding NtrC family response regulator
LRERIEDIPDLIRHFFSQAAREGLPTKQIDPAALDRLKHYRWPGNVRELENLARRLAALYPQETIAGSVIDVELTQPAATAEKLPTEESLSGAVERTLSRYFANFGNELPPPGLYHRILREIETPLLSAALAATRATNSGCGLAGFESQYCARKSVISTFRSSGLAGSRIARCPVNPAIYCNLWNYQFIAQKCCG